MFAEYLMEKTWQAVLPGVQTCTFTYSQPDEKQLHHIPVQMGETKVEVLYCIEGSLTVTRKSGTSSTVGAREILLLANCNEIESVTYHAPLKGLCIVVDRAGASASLGQLCQFFGGLPMSMRQVGEIMQTNGGFYVVHGTPWSCAVFYAMKSIPDAERGRYCLLKTFELLYLLCSHATDNIDQTVHPSCNGYLCGLAASMKSYMEEHLDEKLTITELSQRFHLSPTACKSCFRTCFGRPIHSWLLDKRMERAAELLEHTKLSILQVAQAVGYTGVSQFNVAFKQRYGQSPSKYRKTPLSIHF